MDKKLRAALAEERRAGFAAVKRLQDENARLREALEKIADWQGAWGPWPERNDAWCSMAVVTAREAVPLETNTEVKGDG